MSSSNKNTSYNQNQQGQTLDIKFQKEQIPKNIDLEEIVLGALMIDRKAVDEAIDLLSEEVFFSEKNKKIFNAIYTLFENSYPIDIHTISEELKRKNFLELVGGELTIINIKSRVSSSANIEYHCRLLQQKAIRRELINSSSKIIEEAQDDTKDTFDVLDKAESTLFDITNNYLKKNTNSAENLFGNVLENLEELRNKEDGVSGLNSGFIEIDKVNYGWQKSDLVVIAARPGMGKTAFILSMARNMVVDFKVPVAIFSLEMAGQQLITRFLSSEIGISSQKLKNPREMSDKEWEMLINKMEELENIPLFIDDTPALSIFDLRAKARRLVSKNNVQMIMIDYLQLMTAGVNNQGLREQEISTISRNLKALAKELNIPIIALAQLSRQVEAQGGAKRPLLSHLRESGAIEQDADIVSFIYRPEYYKIEQWDDDEKTSTKGQAEFIIAKHRNGGLENVKLKFTPELTKFDNLDNLKYMDYDESNKIKTISSKYNKLKIDPKKDEIFDTINNNITTNNENNETPF